jgi:hypothetical protein
MYDAALKKAYKTAFDFIMPTPCVTKNIPPQIQDRASWGLDPCKTGPDELIYADTLSRHQP